MGAVKEYYHDIIEQELRGKVDKEWYQRYMADKKEEAEYFYNLKLTKWQRLLIQLKAWRSRFISTILRIFRIG